MMFATNGQLETTTNKGKFAYKRPPKPIKGGSHLVTLGKWNVVL